jgi:carbon storage regulator CsrA
MLVFMRRDGERFLCEQLGLVVTVLESRRGRVKLGIEAPESLRFQREEVLDRLKRAEEVSQSVPRVA